MQRSNLWKRIQSETEKTESVIRKIKKAGARASGNAKSIIPVDTERKAASGTEMDSKAMEKPSMPVPDEIAVSPVPDADTYTAEQLLRAAADKAYRHFSGKITKKIYSKADADTLAQQLVQLMEKL